MIRQALHVESRINIYISKGKKNAMCLEEDIYLEK